MHVDSQTLTVGIVALSYLIGGLLAWGRLTTKLDDITKNQDKMITNDALRAAIAEMKNDLGDRIEKKIEKALEQRARRSTDDG